MGRPFRPGPLFAGDCAAHPKVETVMKLDGKKIKTLGHFGTVRLTLPSPPWLQLFVSMQKISSFILVQLTVRLSRERPWKSPWVSRGGRWKDSLKINI